MTGHWARTLVGVRVLLLCGVRRLRSVSVPIGERARYQLTGLAFTQAHIAESVAPVFGLDILLRSFLD